MSLLAYYIIIFLCYSWYSNEKNVCTKELEREIWFTTDVISTFDSDKKILILSHLLHWVNFFFCYGKSRIWHKKNSQLKSPQMWLIVLFLKRLCFSNERNFFSFHSNIETYVWSVVKIFLINIYSMITNRVFWKKEGKNNLEVKTGRQSRLPYAHSISISCLHEYKIIYVAQNFLEFNSHTTRKKR